MDVSCPRCQTEYDFDEARIPDDGITVKCTQCGHVFRVNRRNDAAALPPPPVAREWKIRRRSTGTTSTCRELTSLQQWIVEGKVIRDDEISLTGDTWKRLGDIPELASFFQLVDDAARGRAYDSVRTASQGSVQPPPPPMPSAPGAATANSSLTETWREPSFKAPVAPLQVPASSLGSEAMRGGFAIPSEGNSKALNQELRTGGRRKLPSADELELERALQSSGRRWPLMILIGLLLGAAAGWYFGVYQPERERKTLEDQGRADRDSAAAAATAVAPPDEAMLAFDAGDAIAGTGVVIRDAGAPPVPDAGHAPAAVTLVEQTPKKNEPKMDFDALEARGEVLLSQDKPEAALSMFGKASDLRPDRVEPMVGRGLSLLDLGNAAASEAAFEQAIRVNPRYGPGIMGLAEALRTQGKYDKAIEWYQRYLEVAPEGTEANVARNNIERLKK